MLRAQTQLNSRLRYIIFYIYRRARGRMGRGNARDNRMKDIAGAAGYGSYNIGRCFLAQAATFINSLGEIIRSREWEKRTTKKVNNTRRDTRKCFEADNERECLFCAQVYLRLK